MNEIIHAVDTNPNLTAYARPGECRKWTLFAIKILRNLPGVKLIVEAREVTLGPEHTHSFAQVQTEEGQRFILDGTGTINNPPYLGPTDLAPEYLKESKPDDMINNYL